MRSRLAILLLIAIAPLRSTAGCAGGEDAPGPPTSLHIVDFDGAGAYERILLHFHPKAGAYRDYRWSDERKTDVQLKRINALLADRKAGDTLAEIPINTWCDGDAFGANRSNGAAAVMDMIEGAHAEGMPGKDLLALARTRVALIRAIPCPGEIRDSALLRDIASAAYGKKTLGYQQYLLAAVRLYTQDYAGALELGRSLKDASSPWVAEAGGILAARAALSAAQKAWDGWSDPAGKVDLRMLEESRKEYAEYLQTYPKGRYRTSAEGMQRRLDYFSGDSASLNAALERQVEAVRIALEKDTNLVPEFYDALVELRRFFRTGTGAPYGSPLHMVKVVFQAPDSLVRGHLQGLEKAKEAYRIYPGLHPLLRLVLLTRLKEEKTIAKEYGSLKPGAPLLQRAQASLLAQALERQGDTAKARALWRGLAAAMPDADSARYFRHRLGATYWTRGEMPAFFRSEAAKDTAVVKSILYRNHAGPGKMFAPACIKGWMNLPDIHPDVRFVLRERLLGILLDARSYREFSEVLDASPKPSASSFAAVQTAARSLAADSNDAKGLVNVGHFLNVRSALPAVFTGDVGARTPFPGGWPADGVLPISCAMEAPAVVPQPFDYFTRALRQFGPKDRNEVEAKALNFLLHCFKRTGDEGKCGGRAEYRQRQAWFRTLNRKYLDSKWNMPMFW